MSLQQCRPSTDLPTTFDKQVLLINKINLENQLTSDISVKLNQERLDWDLNGIWYKRIVDFASRNTYLKLVNIYSPIVDENNFKIITEESEANRPLPVIIFFRDVF